MAEKDLEGALPGLTYNADGLIPCIVQDADTLEVLMMAWMSAESLRLTMECGETVFFSRSRRELWHKGATSGNTQRVVELRYDCDADTLLALVRPAGPACHTGARSCFYRRVDAPAPTAAPRPAEGLRASAPSAWRAWARAWGLAALSFRVPGEGLASLVASGAWLDDARALADELGLALPEGFGAGLLDGEEAQLAAGGLCCDAQTGVCRPVDPAPTAAEVLMSLRAEAERLLGDLCDPHEGAWRDGDGAARALLFGNPHTMDVERFCRACGMGAEEGRLDHVAAECELLARLAGTAEDPRGGASSLPGGSAGAAYASFLADHARAWMPAFAQAVAARTDLPFYRAAAAFLAALAA